MTLRWWKPWRRLLMGPLYALTERLRWTRATEWILDYLYPDSDDYTIRFGDTE